MLMDVYICGLLLLLFAGAMSTSSSHELIVQLLCWRSTSMLTESSGILLFVFTLEIACGLGNMNNKSSPPEKRDHARMGLFCISTKRLLFDFFKLNPRYIAKDMNRHISLLDATLLRLSPSPPYGQSSNIVEAIGKRRLENSIQKRAWPTPGSRTSHLLVPHIEG
jgi:hypothetical protein